MSFNRQNQNPYAGRVNRRLRESQWEQIVRKNETLDILGRIGWFKDLIIWVFLPCLIVFSAFTEFSFLFANYFESSHNVYHATGLSTLWTLLIEVSKIAIGMMFFKMLVHRWVFESWIYALVFVVVLPFVFAAYGGSAYLSVSSGSVLSSFWTKQSQPMVLIDKDSINTAYDQRLASYSKKQDDAHTQKYRKKLTAEGAILSLSIQESINLIEKERSTALQQADLDNEEIKATYKAGIEDRGGWFSIFAGLGEAGTFLFTLLLVIIKRVAYLEKKPPSPTNRRRRKKEPEHQTDEVLEENVERPVLNGHTVGEQGKHIDIHSRKPLNDVERFFESEAKVVDLQYTKFRCKQTYQRSKSYKKPDHQIELYGEFRKQLEELGIIVIETVDEKGSPTLEFDESNLVAAC